MFWSNPKLLLTNRCLAYPTLDIGKLNNQIDREKIGSNPPDSSVGKIPNPKSKIQNPKPKIQNRSDKINTFLYC